MCGWNNDKHAGDQLSHILDFIIDPAIVGAHAVCDQCPVRVSVTLVPSGNWQQSHVSTQRHHERSLSLDHVHEAKPGGGGVRRLWQQA